MISAESLSLLLALLTASMFFGVMLSGRQAIALVLFAASGFLLWSSGVLRFSTEPFSRLFEELAATFGIDVVYAYAIVGFLCLLFFIVGLRLGRVFIVGAYTRASIIELAAPIGLGAVACTAMITSATTTGPVQTLEQAVALAALVYVAVAILFMLYMMRVLDQVTLGLTCLLLVLGIVVAATASFLWGIAAMALAVAISIGKMLYEMLR